MENNGVRRLGITRRVSKGAGTCVGTIAFAGKKITSLMSGSLTTVGHLLTRPVETFEYNTDERVESASETFAVKSNPEETRVSQNVLKEKASPLKSELVEARVQLEEAKDQAEQTQERLTLQLENLQKERDSLLSDVEQARKEFNEETKSHQDTDGTHVVGLKSELSAAKCELNHTRELEKDVKDLSSDIHVMPPSAEINTKNTISKPDDKPNVSVEEYLSKPGIAEHDIPISEAAGNLKAQQEKLPKQQEKFQTKQTSKEVESSAKTTTNQSDGQKHPETEAQEFEPVIAETSSLVSADVTVEEVNAADFESAAEKIIFNNAFFGMSSPNKAARLDAIKIIAGIHHELSVRSLVGQMAKESAVQIRVECIKALAKLNMREGLPAIKNALSEESVSVRLAAVRCLYSLGGLTSAPELVQMLGDENEDVRRRTACCIGWVGKEELALELVPLLDDSSISVRLAAVEAMSYLRNREVVSDLIVHLEDSEKEVRKAIIAALKKITGKKMSGPFPKDKKTLQILTVRWAEWWKDEYKMF